MLLGVALAAASPRVGGHVESTVRLGLCCELIDASDTAVVGAWVEGEPSSRVRARAAVDLRLHPAEEALSAVVRDGWLAVEGDRLELRTGVQRVRWGTAPLSVLDPLNPPDLENPLSLASRRPSPLALLVGRAGRWDLQLAATPWFAPAVLPRSGPLVEPEALGADFEGLQVGELELDTTRPQWGPSAGLRIARTGQRVDLAALWHVGPDPLPQGDGELLITGFQTDTDRVDVRVPMAHPWRQLGGLELAAELPGEVLLLAEAALVLPAATSWTVSEAQLRDLERIGTLDEVPDPLPVVVTQDGRPYPRAFAGLERGFGGLRVGAGWLHGLPSERRRGELGDYALVSLRWAATDTWVLSAQGLGDASGGLGLAESAWLIGDAAELRLGGAWAAETFEPWSDLTQVYAGARVAF